MRTQGSEKRLLVVATFAEELTADIDRLVRGEALANGSRDPEYQAMMAAARLLTRRLRPLRDAPPAFEAQLEARLVAQLPAATRPWWQRLCSPGPRMVELPTGLVGVAIVFLLVVLGAGMAVAASSLVQVYRPESPAAGGANAKIIAPPLLPPSGTVRYRVVDPLQAAGETGRAVAYLPEPPAGVDEIVDVGLLPQTPFADSSQIALAIRAIVRYRGGGHSVWVVLDEPSTAMAQQREISLGERTIRLPDGREAWPSTRPNWPVPNVVATVMDRYVVLVASDLAPGTVEKLAAQVALVPATGHGTEPDAAQRYDDAPGSLPPAAPDGKAELMITGEVRRDRGGSQPALFYSLQFGNRGDGWAKEVLVTVDPPATLAQRVVDARLRWSFGEMGPGELRGFGGDIKFDALGLDEAAVQEALAEDVVVHVTWKDGEQKQERTFPIR